MFQFWCVGIGGEARLNTLTLKRYALNTYKAGITMALDLNTPCRIEKLMQAPAGQSLADVAYVRKTYEDHLPLFWANSQLVDGQPATTGGLTNVQIDVGLAHQCRGDFIMLMRALGWPIDQDWINMRINGLKHPVDYDGVTTTIFKVGESLLAKVNGQILIQLKPKIR